MTIGGLDFDNLVYTCGINVWSSCNAGPASGRVFYGGGPLVPLEVRVIKFLQPMKSC